MPEPGAATSILLPKFEKCTAKLPFSAMAETVTTPGMRAGI